MRQTNASAAVEQDLLEVALTHERLTQARAHSQRLGGLVWTGIATLLGVSLSLLIVNEIFYWTLRGEIQKKRLDPTHTILTATRAREQSFLTQYRWLKKSDGIVRIPVKRAADLVIAEYAHPALPVAAPAASATSPTPPTSPARSASAGSAVPSVASVSPVRRE